jgi:hypothetical protein
VPVRVRKEKLERTIRSLDRTAEDHVQGLKILLPGLEIVDAQRKMVSARLRNQLLDSLATNDVQFLHSPEPKPRAREIKTGPWDLFELQNLAIESTASFNVAHANGNVI